MNIISIDTSMTLPLAMTVFFLTVVVLYFIIKVAAKDANREMTNQITLQNNLKILEMKKNGYSEEDIKGAIDRTFK